MGEKRRTDNSEAVVQKGTPQPADGLLDSFFNALSPIMKDLPENQAEALEKQVREDLASILFPNSWVGFNASVFAENISLDNEPCASYMRRLAPVKQINQDDFLAVYGLADFLDHQADPANDTPLALFMPDGFFFTRETKLFVLKPYLHLLAIDPTLARVTRFQRTEGAVWLHPDLDGTISLTSANPHMCVLYGWALLIAQAWLGIKPAPRREVLEQLSKCRVLEPTLPPHAVDTIMDVLNTSVDVQSKMTCHGLLDIVINSFIHNPLRLGKFLCSDVSHEQFHYSIPGRHKKNPTNEDRAGTLHAGNVNLVYVADGVSTADLGTGEIAAELSAFAVRNKQITFSDWSLAVKDKKDEWCDKAHKFLRQVFMDANASTAEWLNKAVRQHQKNPTVLHPMCTTFSAAIVCGNQAVVHSLGDSPVLLYQESTKKLIKLSIEHTVAMERDGTERIVIDEDCSDEYLTRVIGASWDDSHNCFIPNTFVAYEIEVQLGHGDILIIASDGLLKCIDSYDERRAIEIIQKNIADSVSKGKTLRDMGQQLTQIADEGSSNDNITVNLLRVKNNNNKSKGD